MIEIKQPKIRFKGHINDWEQRKLSEITTHRGGTSIERYFDGHGKYKVISIGSYGLDSKYNEQGLRAVSNELTNSKVVKSGELTMVLNDKTSNGTIIGRALLIEEEDTFVVNQRTEIIKPNSEFDSQFAYVSLNGVFREKVKRIVQGGTQIYVNYKSVENLDINLPNLDEQKKIGEFFKTLDDTIALHQQKLEVTKQFKQTMLKKMFPKNGETTPEIRFKGFTEDWEECKLGDLCDILSGYNWKSKDYTDDGKFKIITIANVTGDYFINIDIGNNIDISNVDNKYVLKENDILITMTGNVGRASKVPSGNYLLNQRVCKISPKSIDNEFLYTILSDIQFENFCVLQGQGLAQANISNKDILNYKISIPNIKEQIIISDFFRNIDLNILHLENKINQCKEIKKTMLKKLFI